MTSRILLLVLLFSGLAACGDEPLPNSGTVPQAEFKKMMKRPDIALIDVRSPGEFASGHIPKAQNIDIESPDFAQKFQQMDKNKPYLLYCQGGFRSGAALKMLQGAGFKNVYDLERGLGQWKGDIER